MAVRRTSSLPLVVLLLIFSTVPLLSFAQATISSGSIVGSVSDPAGAFINGADVKITNTATEQAIEITTNTSGAFDSGALVPGNYRLLVSARRFASVETALTVQMGNTATVNLRLRIGDQKEVIEVQDSAVRVNTEQ